MVKFLSHDGRIITGNQSRYFDFLNRNPIKQGLTPRKQITTFN